MGRGGGGMWSLHYNPYRTMSAKKPPPVTHNAEREMANMQQKYKAAPGLLKELHSTSLILQFVILKSTC